MYTLCCHISVCRMLYTHWVKFDHKTLVYENWPSVYTRLKNSCLYLHSEKHQGCTEAAEGEGFEKETEWKEEKYAVCRSPYSTVFIVLLLLSWMKYALAASKESRKGRKKATLEPHKD